MEIGKSSQEHVIKCTRGQTHMCKGSYSLWNMLRRKTCCAIIATSMTGCREQNYARIIEVEVDCFWGAWWAPNMVP